jgi:hypothetical protein
MVCRECRSVGQWARLEIPQKDGTLRVVPRILSPCNPDIHHRGLVTPAHPHFAGWITDDEAEDLIHALPAPSGDTRLMQHMIKVSDRARR